MAIVIDDLKNNKLYRKKIFLPSDTKNRRKNSAIFLMTPDYASSVKAMNNPYFLNNRRFESYYIEKDISFILTEDHRLMENTDDITVVENSIPQYRRVTCSTKDELKEYGIECDDGPDSFTAQVFVDCNGQYYGYLILTDSNTCIYKIEAYSHQMKEDLIQAALIFFDIRSARVWDNLNRESYLDAGFKPMKYDDEENCRIMVREASFLFENSSLNKIDLEIKLWEAQIKITELIIKNFNNDNWMSHIYKDIKRKLNKIPLDEYVEATDDTLERWKDKLVDQKATLNFYIAIKSIEGKELFDISDLINEYIKWVESLSCPKSLKLKIINEAIASYNKTIKECEYNLKRYRALDDASKRVENVMAIVTKISSTFSFISGGPMSILKGSIIKSILPKSQKKNVLSEAELEAKIELYTKIVETLEDQKKKVESLEESTILESNKDVYYFISGSSEDDEIIYYTEGGIGIYDNLITAIQRYPHKKYKLYVYSANLNFANKDNNGRIEFEGGAALNLLGEISVTYNISGDVRSYEWIKRYDADGVAVKEDYTLNEGSILDLVKKGIADSFKSNKSVHDGVKLVLKSSVGLANVIIPPSVKKSMELIKDDIETAKTTKTGNNTVGQILSRYYEPGDIAEIAKSNNLVASTSSYETWTYPEVMNRVYDTFDNVCNQKGNGHTWSKNTYTDKGMRIKLIVTSYKDTIDGIYGVFATINGGDISVELITLYQVSWDTSGKPGDISGLSFKAKQEKVVREFNVLEGYVAPYIDNGPSLTSLGLQTEDSITFLEGNDEVLVEGDAAYNGFLRRILYSERIKNHKQVILLYKQLKNDCPWINYTFINYNRYQNKNLFIDWSYYTGVFFKNNMRRYDKAVDLYFEFINRFLEDTRLNNLGYTKKTVMIPVDDWIPMKDREYWDYKLNLNPISVIYRLTYRDIDKLRTGWGNYTFIFTGKNGYFKMNFAEFEKKNLPRFMQNIKSLVDNEPVVDTDEPDNSVDGIVNQVIDRIESDSDIKINNLTGTKKVAQAEVKKKVDQADISSEKPPEIDKEEELVAAITTAASKSKDDVETFDKINNDDYVKQLVIDLRNSSPDTVTIEPTRAARMRKINDTFAKKVVSGKTVSEIISNPNDAPLPETSLPIDTINDEWKHMTYLNHSKEYNLNEDIIRCLNHFSNTTVPVSILDINTEDTSTSEDWVETWTVKCEDSYGKRFTLKFDIPKLRNSRSMHLRGNDKTINGQLMNLPIIKTEENTCQMTSNYNKIFFSGYGTSLGKSYVIADRIIKTLNKMEKDPDITIEFGDNSLICAKYELPTDYIDIASAVSKITVFNRHIKAKYTLFFNQDELLQKYGNIIKNKDSFPVGIVEQDNSKPAILYAKLENPVSFDIYEILAFNSKFVDTYNTTGLSVRYTYSKASILNTNIPVAVIIGYYIGLIPMLDRLGVKYEVSDKRPKYDKNLQDIIKLDDAFIVYDLNYDSSMLLNGLKECDTSIYSLKDVNSKKMWVEFLDNFGGRLKADGLDMFYDLMIDPITGIVCDKYQLPKDFVDALLYANMLLSDNKYNKHTNVTGNRYRTNEIIAGYTYKALCNSYTQYRRDLRSGRDAKMTIKQSAVLDLLFVDNTFGDLSSLNDLLEWESLSATSFKGLSGMNSDRAYGLDKRTFDESMVNLLALSTGFSANAGINRQSTIDMDIDSARGYIKNTSSDKMSITKTFAMTEALTPFGTTSDDPFRSAMTFIQTSKHGMRTKISDPSLVTNGADQALPYMTSNTLTYKTKNAGKVKEKTDDYMVLEYKDGTTEVIDLRERILKNSDGGMYIAVKLDTELKEGNVFSAKEIVAYDKTSYSNGIGPTNNLAYDIGTFVKFAIINSDEGFEDSCIETEWIADAMSSTVVLNKEYTLPKDTNVYFIAKKGQAIQDGDPLLIFQNAFDEDDANMLIKSLSDEDGDNIIEELGRIPIHSKVTGVVKDIKILRTVEKEELSPSLKKIVNDYEKDVNSFNKVLDKYDKEKAKIADATYKLEPTGKLKNAANSVRIEFSLAYEDKFGVGDKTVCYSALKGVSKGKIPLGLEPYSTFRPDEKIHYIQSTNGDMKRMVGSILKVGALNKVMVELARQSCDIMGIKWKYFDEY